LGLAFGTIEAGLVPVVLVGALDPPPELELVVEELMGEAPPLPASPDATLLAVDAAADAAVFGAADPAVVVVVGVPPAAPPKGLRAEPLILECAGVVWTFRVRSVVPVAGVGVEGSCAVASGAEEELESSTGTATIPPRRRRATGQSFFWRSSLNIPRRARGTAEKSRFRFIARWKR
jgi:hypothetical protein